ncbi:unnamed protein product [Victoria cruziana]
MASALVPATVGKLWTAETIRSAAKQSLGIELVPHRLRRAIRRFLQEQEQDHMKRKVLRLSESFNEIKDVNIQITAATSRELVEDPLMASSQQSKRWKIKSEYGDIGLKYTDNETAAYVAARMPAVYCACHRVLREVSRRLVEFTPKKALDFGSGSGSVIWAMHKLWPHSLERINLVEPSKSMLRASINLLQDVKGLPLIQNYESIQALSRKLEKHEREHDLVVCSYVLGEIPSLKDRITTVRQLWDLTQDVLVLIEPGTPLGFSIISQMRSHILWMAKRRSKKSNYMLDEASKEKVEAADSMISSKTDAFIVAPCPHDGPCPLENTGKYCHFVQRLERTSSQRAYKKERNHTLRGFEDEKFCYVVIRRGERPRSHWPLNGMRFETLKEQHARRNPEDLEIDFEDQILSEVEDVPYEADPGSEVSDLTEVESDADQGEKIEETVPADLGGGWGRIIFTPVRRGKRVTLDVCRSTKQDGSEGCFERVVVTQHTNPTLHLQARRSLWGDLWPF